MVGHLLIRARYFVKRADPPYCMIEVVHAINKWNLLVVIDLIGAEIAPKMLCTRRRPPLQLVFLIAL